MDLKIQFKFLNIFYFIIYIFSQKKKFKVGPRVPKTGVLKKRPFWAASKGRTNWRQTAFSPCEAELILHPRAPPDRPPRAPLLEAGGLRRSSTM